MINEVRNMVLFVLNKENQGYIGPEQFNSYSKQSQTEIFVEMFNEYSNAVNRRNRGLQRTGHSDRVRQLITAIDTFSVDAPMVYNGATQLFDKPSDLFDPSLIYIDATNVEVELATNAEAKRLLRTPDGVPTTTYPIGVPFDNGIQIYPTTVTSGVMINYIRYPVDPKWTYLGLSGGEPVFNQSANDYQDFELPERYEYDLCVRILKFCGVEISKEQIVQFSKSEEVQKKQENII